MSIVTYAINEGKKASLSLLRGDEVFIVGGSNPIYLKQASDPFASAVSNVLVGNEEYAPVFEVYGYAEFAVKKLSLVAVAGRGSVEVRESSSRVKMSLWRAFPLPPGSVLVVRGNPLYVAFKGLKTRWSGKRRVRPGNGFEVSSVSSNGDLEDLPARYLPLSFLLEAAKSGVGRNSGAGELLKIIERIKKHVKLACDAVRRGAKLVRVRVDGKSVDVWVEEVFP